jgi:membrane protein
MGKASGMNNRTNSWDSLKAFGKELYRIWITERPGPLAASLAYYAIFSIIPVTYIAITIAGFFIDASTTINHMLTITARIFGAEAVEAIQQSVADLAERTGQGSAVASAISFVVLLFTASLIFFQVQYVLNSIWRVPPPSGNGTRAFVKNRLIAFVMVLGVGPLLVLATMTSIIVSFFGSILGIEAVVVLFTFLTYLGMATLSFAVIYKYLPNAEIAWRDVWVGSLITASLMIVAIYLFVKILSLTTISSAFHAAGAAAAFLIAFYFFAQIFVVGAVITRVYASMFGSKIIPTDSLPSQPRD